MNVNPCEKSSLAPSFQEAADIWLFVHAADVAKEGHQRIMIRTMDIDVVILAIPIIPILNVTELWLAFQLPLGTISNPFQKIGCPINLFNVPCMHML